MASIFLHEVVEIISNPHIDAWCAPPAARVPRLPPRAASTRHARPTAARRARRLGDTRRPRRPRPRLHPRLHPCPPARRYDFSGLENADMCVWKFTGLSYSAADGGRKVYHNQLVGGRRYLIQDNWSPTPTPSGTQLGCVAGV
jgi:hypothetical protein